MICLDTVDELTRGRLGTFDTTCPQCSAFRHSPANRRAKIFRIWRLEPGFASYYCAHCGTKGYSRDQDSPPPDPARLERARQQASLRHRNATKERLHTALWLWSQRKPIPGTPAEPYVRQARRYRGPLPGTLGFLPAHGEHPPTLIAAFGLAHEIEPGVIAIRDSAIRGVHLIRLLPDGSDRERGDHAKIMIGHSTGSPIVLAPPNDLLGLAIAEGVEDALSAHEATGLGAWAAGCGSRLPALADVVPGYIDAITIFAHEDLDGQRFAADLHRRLLARSFEAGLITLNQQGAA
jgi:hypothetical protein